MKNTPKGKALFNNSMEGISIVTDKECKMATRVTAGDAVVVMVVVVGLPFLMFRASLFLLMAPTFIPPLSPLLLTQQSAGDHSSSAIYHAERVQGGEQADTQEGKGKEGSLRDQPPRRSSSASKNTQKKFVGVDTALRKGAPSLGHATRVCQDHLQVLLSLQHRLASMRTPQQTPSLRHAPPPPPIQHLR
ncbi:hypothetical protein E2C01_000342 [Portunus trituberculatus]|uniref:Uncharacterized protein n=1 Tax=Portunus trituberculatus TaxID=210409 RepID=A0A5B7CEP2_PORTR|nr:hypothetical protein [Portunus trituberculatus]